MGGLGVSHVLIMVLVVVVLFGARRLPDAARGVARSLRVFKSEIADQETPTPAKPVAEAAGDSAPAKENENEPAPEKVQQPPGDVKTLAAQWGQKIPPPLA